MNQFIKCRTNPREVEAIQWNGENTDQLKHWGCPVGTKPDDEGIIYIGELGDEEPVFVGWWIVKDPDDNLYWPEPPEKFALWFEPITESHTNTHEVVSQAFDGGHLGGMLTGHAEGYDLGYTEGLAAAARVADNHAAQDCTERDCSLTIAKDIRALLTEPGEQKNSDQGTMR